MMLKGLKSIIDNIKIALSAWNLLAATGFLTLFGTTAFLTSLSDIIKPYGILGIFFISLFFTLLFSVILFLIILSIRNYSEYKLNSERLIKPSRINILKDHFENEIIEFGDIFYYFHQRLQNKSFRNCRFKGPILIAVLDGIRFDRCAFKECNYVVIDQDAYITGVVGFERSDFVGCDFDCVTFLLPKSIALELRRKAIENGQRVTFIGARLD